MEKKKTKVEVKEKEGEIIVTFVPPDSFVMPFSILINFEKRKKKEE